MAAQLRLLTVEQLSELTGWKVATIRQKVWLRQLPYIKLGRSIRFKEAEILKLIEESSVAMAKAR